MSFFWYLLSGAWNSVHILDFQLERGRMIYKTHTIDLWDWALVWVFVTSSSYCSYRCRGKHWKFKFAAVEILIVLLSVYLLARVIGKSRHGYLLKLKYMRALEKKKKKKRFHAIATHLMGTTPDLYWLVWNRYVALLTCIEAYSGQEVEIRFSQPGSLVLCYPCPPRITHSDIIS